jgi:hypothetical protein
VLLKWNMRVSDVAAYRAPVVGHCLACGRTGTIDWAALPADERLRRLDRRLRCRGCGTRGQHIIRIDDGR